MTQKYILEEQNGEVVAIKNPKYWSSISKEKYELLLRKSHIPQNYHDLDFDNYQGNLSESSVRKSKLYAINCYKEKFHNVSLYLVGNHSTQKTMIACAIGKEFIRQGLQVQFVFAGELIDDLFKTQGFDRDAEIESRIKQYSEADLLIIDDIFDSKKSIYWHKNPDMIIALWDTFLRRQISEDKRVILTSNYTIDVIHEKFGESLYQLINRNFLQFEFFDSITNIRRQRFDNLFEKED